MTIFPCTAFRSFPGRGLFLVLMAIAASAQSPQADDSRPVLLTESSARQMIKYKVDPEYPATARQFHISGPVVTEITIGTDGKVESVDDAKGNPILQASVKTTLRRWIFNPYQVGGKPIRVKTVMTFYFRL